jgi:hypothetical protein
MSKVKRKSRPQTLGVVKTIVVRKLDERKLVRVRVPPRVPFASV